MIIISAQLLFNVQNQIITRTDNFQPVAKSRDYLRAGFTFSADWNEPDTEKIAVFKDGGRAYKVILDENNECIVPWEALTNAGTLYVSVFCGNRITASTAQVPIMQSGYTDETTATQDPSIDVFAELMGRMNEIDEHIPSNTSDLVNDSGFITVDDIDIPEPATPDWNAEDGTPGYIENKPGIYSGDALGLRTNYGVASGAAAIALGTTSTSYIVRISGDANATEYTYSQQYAPSLSWYQMAMVETGKVRIRANGVIAYITAIDTTARTITVDSTLSASALSNQSANILFTTTASGNSSVAVGRSVYSTGTSSFAYGSYNLASGNDSVASGVQTVSSGTQSSTKGKGTIANHKSQDVSGEYNIEDSNVSANTERGTYVEIVGNGTADNARSNARTLDWSGNEWLSGTLKIGGAGYTDANAKEISTKEYVDNASSALETSLKTYTDNALSALETSLKKYTDDTNDTLEASLKQYTDDALSTLETSLKQYTDNAISTLETSLKQYIDTSISSSINTEDTALKQYVDDAIARYVQTTANMSVTGTTLNILGEE